MKPIARAIDIGYGNTKFTVTDGLSGGEMQCRMFPSVAPVAGNHAVDGFLQQKDCVEVEVDGERYVAGPDVMLAMSSNTSRTLDLDFVQKPTYMALARGAMAYMDVEEIHHLVVGLPVSSMEALSKVVERKLRGQHELPQGTVTVHEVTVRAQPLGGLVDFGLRHKLFDEMDRLNTLVIDPGYYTLDWVVVNGKKPNGARSSSAPNAGMAAALRAIAERMAARIKERDGKPADINEAVLARIDEALRLGTPFRYNGRVEPLKEHVHAADHVIEDGLNKLRTSVGSMVDLDRIICVGGGAHLYKNAVTRIFDGYDVRVASQSVFANVRGFQMLANMAAVKAKEPRGEDAAAAA